LPSFAARVPPLALSLMATNASVSFKIRPDTIESLAINIIGLDRA